MVLSAVSYFMLCSHNSHPSTLAMQDSLTDVMDALCMQSSVEATLSAMINSSQKSMVMLLWFKPWCRGRGNEEVLGVRGTNTSA